MSENNKKETESTEKPDTAPKDNLVTTHHTLTIHGKTIAYDVNAGTIVLKEEATKTGDREGESEGEKPRATIFFISYTRTDGDPDPKTRPLTFSFNGGPGSSSVWLHLGLLGPRRVDMGQEGRMPPPPFHLVDNLYTLLEETDLVFIDPVSTGFSRPVVGEKAKLFHAFKKDIESVGDFIRLYTSRYGRWNSPKFLIGESYGTTRAAGLAGYLQDRHGFYLNGVMLISVVLDFTTLEFNPGNDLPPLLFLPTYTATAWYHQRLAEKHANLSAALERAEEFATGRYAQALFSGSALSEDERREIAAELARLTGVDQEYVLSTDLRINIHRYVKELLRDQRRTVGRLDSRFTGLDRDSAGEFHEHDPSLSEVVGPYTSCFNDYIRRELQYENDLPYEILNPNVWPWSFSDHENQYVNVAETLRQAISKNPYLKVIVANGYYDLATPYFASKYTFNHLGLDPSLRENIHMTYYEAGHMMYIHIPSLSQLKDDLATFIHSAIPSG